ncbi:hypothetical protein LCGC14_1292140, partial [marine sediment metagenome]
MLKINLASGLKLKSPIILASGILGVSFSSMKRVMDAGAGAVTTKSIGPVPRKGYKNPSIIPIYPGTFMNSVGLGNPGINDFISEIKEIKNFNIPLIVSVFGDNNEVYLNVALKAEKAGADAIEINISCPHAEVSSIGIDKDLTFSIVKFLKEKLTVPLFVKLNPNVTNIGEIALAAENGGADGVVAINTLAAMKIDVITVKLTVHLLVDPGDIDSVQEAARHADALLRYSTTHGTASMESRLNRVSVHEIQPPAAEPEPEPAEPADDGLDIPDR